MIERKIRGVNYGKNIVKGEHKVLLSDGGWVDFNVWQEAKKTGTKRTKEQMELLYKGHLKPIKRGGK